MKSKALSRTDALNCIPVRNPRVVEHHLETGEMLLSYPDAVKPWFAGILSEDEKSA